MPPDDAAVHTGDGSRRASGKQTGAPFRRSRTLRERTGFEGPDLYGPRSRSCMMLLICWFIPLPVSVALKY